MTKVKICGITNLEDATAAVQCGADILGFNFYAGSPRYLPPLEARLIVEKLPKEIEKVGVFVNTPHNELLEIAETSLLDTIQLHGDEDDNYIETLRKRTSKSIIRVIRMHPGLTAGELKPERMDAVLLDAYKPDLYGGTGETFDWELAGRIAALVPRLYLAGGLNPSNVSAAIERVRPYAVDVASGIESTPGKKDLEKLKAFVENAKLA